MLLPLSSDQLGEWRGSVEKAQQVRKTVCRWWDANLKKYAPDPSDDPVRYGAELNTNRDFTLVERKKADLFFQRPDVTAIPSPLMVGQEALLDTHTQILNEKLGLDGVDAKRLVHQALFDALCPSGTGWTVMGYEATLAPVPGELDPMSGQPVEVPIYEECFWRWLSPKAGLIPSEFRSTVWDDAPWLGYDFELPLRTAKRKGWVPEDFKGSPSDPELYFDHGLSPSTIEAVVKGTVIYYKSALYRDDIIHPQHQTLLILIEGVDQPAEHKDSPYQTLDPQGRLTPDSLIGFPIHPLTLRTLTDSAYVPSNCTISRPTVNEMNTFRTQMVQFRDAAILRWMYNVDTLPPEALSKIVRSPIGGFIGVPAEAFHGDSAVKELPHGSYPRENFAIHDYLDNDLSRAWALDEAQQGVQSEGATTATEVQTQQANANTVLGFERGVTLDWYLRGVTKFSTLIQRYLPPERAAMIVGPEAAQAWEGWRKQVPASLAFTALPDSALRTDLAWERKRAMDEYTFFANDPFINRAELLKQLLPRLNYSQKVLNLQPPEKQPEAAKATVSFKLEDFNPLTPHFAIAVELAAQCGLKISPEAIQQAQAAAMNQMLLQQTVAQAAPANGAGPETAHGGKAAQMESLSKHANQETGGMQGTGAPAPMGAGNMVQ